MLLLAMLFWIAPNVRQPRFRWLTVGGFVALLATRPGLVRLRPLRGQLRLLRQDVRQPRRGDRLPGLDLPGQLGGDVRRRGQRRGAARAELSRPARTSTTRCCRRVRPPTDPGRTRRSRCRASQTGTRFRRRRFSPGSRVAQNAWNGATQNTVHGSTTSSSTRSTGTRQGHRRRSRPRSSREPEPAGEDQPETSMVPEGDDGSGAPQGMTLRGGRAAQPARAVHQPLGAAGRPRPPAPRRRGERGAGRRAGRDRPAARPGPSSRRCPRCGPRSATHNETQRW